MNKHVGDGTPQQSKDSTPQSAARSLAPAAATFAGVLLAFLVVAMLINQRDEREQRVLFESETSASFASIESEIGRQVDVVEDLTAFAHATWPGDIEEWRRYLRARASDREKLAFTSTAGFLELVPADEIDTVIAREREVDPGFSIDEPLPLSPTAERYVLTRAGLGGGDDVRGLEMSAALLLTNVSLPALGDRLLLHGIDEAPDVVESALGIEPRRFAENDIYGTNVVFINVVGGPGSDLGSPQSEDPIGWIVVPADLGLLLEDVVETLEGELSIRIRVPDAPVEGDLGRYEGAGSLAFADASFQSVETVDVGGWLWRVEMWSDGNSREVGPARLTVGLGLLTSVLMAAVVENRRRHGQRLVEARIELSTQRTLAETDHLTGLRNRQGLAALRKRWSADQLHQTRGAVLFIDLDGFKAINDELGHAAGDAVLVRVAGAIRSVTRRDDVVVRTGGDEFVMVCPGMVDRAVIESRVDAIRQALGADDSPAPVGASLGWSIATRSLAGELDDLIADADAAMYRDKETRRLRAKSSL